MFEFLVKKVVMVPSLTGAGRFALIFLSSWICWFGSPLFENSKSSAAETSLTTLRQQTRQLLIEEASLEENTPNQEAMVSALCDLYVILRSDDRYTTSKLLQGDAAKIRRRLIGIATRRTHQLRRQGIDRPAELSLVVEEAIAESLAKQQSDASESAARLDPSQTQRELGAAGGAPLGGNPLLGNPWGLIELIQRVIDPDLWDVQGGPATIRYFAMRRVLVVRATTDTHEKIRDLLMALR